MTEPVRANANASTRGVVYQLCVALERCFDLEPGQRLLIEELGDVTIDEHVQLEVKHYSDALTDGHPNFWNTLYNWTVPAFEASKYTALILHTTQCFGKLARLAGWNGLDADARLALLRDIHADAEKALSARMAKDASTKPSKTLAQQRELLNGERLSALKGVVGKIMIEAQSVTLTELAKRLLASKAQHVLDSNAQRYMNALLAFVCRTDKVAGDRWEISHQEFKAEVEFLTSTFCSESREFPRAQFDRQPNIDNAEILVSLFVSKIRNIGCSSRLIVRAINDYQGTINTIAHEFREYTASRSRLLSFQSQVEQIFEYDYEGACLSSADIDADSRKFYVTTMAKLPPNFPGYADSPLEFRNGLLHMMMDDEERDRVWRLKDE